MSGELAAPEPVEPIAAALRADAADIGTLTRVLVTSLPEALPDGMVDVERDRSLADRMAGRPGSVTKVTVTFPDRVLELRPGDGHPVAEARHVVRGVVISRQRVGLDEWVHELATGLAALASRDAAARSALAALLGAGEDFDRPAAR
ncbi:MAG TPA: hypothetical protein VLS51_07195 [Propionibacteriaceae bacterium]|nr:hypothetical protein [Propionibacteriaceae bacterium]